MTAEIDHISPAGGHAVTTIGLVACGKGKLERPAAARDLYTGALFRKASAYSGATYDQWFILSAKHGLLAPDDWVEPYDLSLRHFSRDERRRWGERVLAEIERRELAPATFFLHAGDRYAEFLAGPLMARRPLAGLGIGRQLAWYKARGF
jgi:hypothetical protein